MIRNLRPKGTLDHVKRSGWMNIFSAFTRGLLDQIREALIFGANTQSHLVTNYQGMRPVTTKNLGKNYNKSKSIYVPHQGKREKFRNKCRYAKSGSVITDTDITECTDFHEIWMRNWEPISNSNAYQRV